MKISSGWLLSLALIFLASAFSCKSGSSGGNGGNNGGAPPVGGGANQRQVAGVVTDQKSGAREPDVEVNYNGKKVMTDAQGKFEFTVPDDQTVLVSFDKDGFATGYASAAKGSDALAMLVKLKPQGEPKPYDPAQQSTLFQRTEAGPYAIIFSPNTLDTTDTNLKVSVTPLDPTKEADVLPGELQTDNALLVPLTFAEFSIFDSTGKKVNLKPGTEAIVELPIPPSLRGLPEYAPGTIIHCYSYNPDTGKWADFVVGQIVTSSVDGSSPVVRASIKHLSWYGAAPESGDCVDVYGHVVSLVDGKPLPNARVESFPGSSTTSDANGDFQLVTAPGNRSSRIEATRTFIDTDGSVTGIPGAKVIEFGEAEIDLVGLVRRPCNGGGGGPVLLGGVLGQPEDRLQLKTSAIGQATYKVSATLSSGGITANLNIALSGEIQGDPVTGATITVTGPQQLNVQLTDAGGGLYFGAADLVPGGRYTLTVDADSNGSIDGSGSVDTVGNVAWIKPAAGASLPAANLEAEWSDDGTASGATYSPTYLAAIFKDDAQDTAFYIGSDRSFTPRSSASQQALKPGHYSGMLWAFSGPFLPVQIPGSSYSPTPNVTGPTVNGSFAAISGQPAMVEFDLE